MVGEWDLGENLVLHNGRRLPATRGAWGSHLQEKSLALRRHCRTRKKRTEEQRTRSLMKRMALGLGWKGNGGSRNYLDDWPSNPVMPGTFCAPGNHNQADSTRARHKNFWPDGFHAHKQMKQFRTFQFHISTFRASLECMAHGDHWIRPAAAWVRASAAV